MTRTFNTALLLAVLALIVSGMTALANAADRSTESILDLDGVEVGKSTLVRNDKGIRMAFRTTDLEPHHAYTIWWVIFNNPGDCASVPCGVPDLFADDVDLTFATATGHVVGESGRGNFSASLRVGDDENLVGAGTAFDSVPLMNPREAEVHLVLRDHGPVNPEFMPDQIQSFGGGCDQGHEDYPPPLVGEGVDGGDDGYACFDPQFSIHGAE